MENNCKNCTHFKEHYVRAGRKFVSIGMGRCMLRVKEGFLGRKDALMTQKECTLWEKVENETLFWETIEDYVAQIHDMLNILLAVCVEKMKEEKNFCKGG